MLTALAAPALAQDAPVQPESSGTPAQVDSTPAEQLPMGQAEAPKAPQAFVKETYKDWRVVCVRADERESCNMQQLLRDADNNAVAQVSVAPMPPAAAPRVAAVEVATPLETLLSEDLLVQIDTSQAKRYRFSFCTPQACVARFALSAEDLAAFKGGKEAKVVIVPLVAPDQKANITMSLAGFTAAFDDALSTMSGQN
ncbi:invasion associated locus B family protein [Rhodovulum sp. BSW8]|nr:invasion associated locus B family protein [Rhodovulum sp. BSW8]